MEKETTQIVLIGGGYASIWAYRSLVHELLIEMMMGRVKISVICPEEFHSYHGWTAESLMGIIRDENRMSPLAEIFKFADLIKGKAVRVDPDSHMVDVQLNDGATLSLPYDQLLLGMGSCDDRSTEGIAEHAYPLKSPEDFLRAKIRLECLLRQAAGKEITKPQKAIRFVVAGSGFTGVEIAANLAELIVVLKKKYPAYQNFKISIHLVNSRENLLPGLDARLSHMRRYAEKIMNQYHVEILHQTKILRVTARGAHLSNGSFIESPMVISTLGQTRIILDGLECMEKDTKKRILMNSFLQTSRHPDIWGAGDFAHIKHAKTSKVCPSTAIWAIKQGEHAGENIARTILSQSLKPFTYPGLGQCASLGIGKGMGELYGIQFTGWIAWIMRWFFFQHFMPSKKVMWREIGDWLYLLFTRRRKDLWITDEEVDTSLSLKWNPMGNREKIIYQN